MKSTELVPLVVEPYRKNRWLFEIKDNDLCLPQNIVKTVSMSGFNMGNKTKLTLCVHSIMKMNTMGQLMTWLKSCEQKVATLKLLDNQGTVQDMWVFEVMPDIIIPDRFDSDDSGYHMLTVILDATLVSVFGQTF